MPRRCRAMMGSRPCQRHHLTGWQDCGNCMPRNDRRSAVVSPLRRSRGRDCWLNDVAWVKGLRQLFRPGKRSDIACRVIGLVRAQRMQPGADMPMHSIYWPAPAAGFDVGPSACDLYQANVLLFARRTQNANRSAKSSSITFRTNSKSLI